MADPDIKRLLLKIDQRIGHLKEIRSKLVALDSELGALPDSQNEITTAEPLASANVSRKAAMAHLLRTNGPMKRRAILDSNIMPAGSVAYCLSDDTRFRRLDSGKWTVVDKEKEE